MSMDRYNQGGTLPLYSTASTKPAQQSNGLGLRSQLNISGYMVFASCVFWICVLIAAIKGFQYGHMYMSFEDEKLEIAGCCQNFGGNLQDNINVIQMYQKGDAGPYLMRLGPESYTSDFKGTPSPKELENVPPIVTAVSTADFYKVQSLIRQWKEDIKENVEGSKLIIYDIGLYSKELQLITKHCDCDVRTFRSSSYPNHVSDITTFAYRPIIMQNIIEEFGSVLWLEPNTILTSGKHLHQLRFRGDRDFFLWQPSEIQGIVAYTNPKTFEYLKESRCCYMESGLIDVSVMAFFRTNHTWNNIFKPWLKCALNKECIAPAKSTYSGCFEMRKPKTTGCHRYDQSVLSVIIERMYGFTYNSEKYAIPRITRSQCDHLQYFPEQPWTYSELLFASIMPFVCIGGLFYMYRRRRSNIVKKTKYSKR